MIISRCNDGKSVYVSWREGKEKKHSIVEHRPYFYVLDKAKEISSYKPSKYIERNFEYEKGDFFKSR
ncbi:MAG: hypothetical protein CM15mV62_360 [uncultured marine virus]|nr:MAG: hypothetical protein CM15mV62_360 [uncultured marine virus]